LKKLEKMRSRTETEMAFMRILKIIQHQVFLRKLPGKVLEKFRVFSDMTVGWRVFDSGERRLRACSRNERGDQYPRKEKA
jgi:hypothetical protein